MAAYFEFDEVDAFTAGAVGRPGQRTFLFQARAAQQRVTVKCEKQQVIALGKYLQQAMTDLPVPTDQPIPAALELVGGVEPVFRAGPMALGFDRDLDRFVLTIEEFPDLDEEGNPDPEFDGSRLRVYITRGQAQGFIGRAGELAAAGRPNCQFCGQPIDPDGHPCPRMN